MSYDFKNAKDVAEIFYCTNRPKLSEGVGKKSLESS